MFRGVVVFLVCFLGGGFAAFCWGCNFGSIQSWVDQHWQLST